MASCKTDFVYTLDIYTLLTLRTYLSRSLLTQLSIYIAKWCVWLHYSGGVWSIVLLCRRESFYLDHGESFIWPKWNAIMPLHFAYWTPVICFSIHLTLDRLTKEANMCFRVSLNNYYFGLLSLIIALYNSAIQLNSIDNFFSYSNQYFWGCILYIGVRKITSPPSCMPRSSYSCIWLLPSLFVICRKCCDSLFVYFVILQLQ